MSLVRLLPAWLHAIADYAVAAALIVVAAIAGGPANVVAVGVVVGTVVLVVSMLTRYPLGVVKVLPFKVHSAGDYLAASLLVASPFALGFTHSHAALSVFYVGAGLAVAAVSLITNYQYSLPVVPAVASRQAVIDVTDTALTETAGLESARRERPLRAAGR
ncbi:MAG TPA: hypothetical protein VNY84_15080 [Acidimicrobiales bacterium]|nr:hypothetical protein [Acidimicrobiales bacterium]